LMTDMHSDNDKIDLELTPDKDLEEVAAPLTAEPSMVGKVEDPLSYYEILNVDHDATRLEVRESYLRLKNTYGAGSAALYSLISEEDAAASMAKVEEAFRVLNDQVGRREYDLRLGINKPFEDRIEGGTSSYGSASYGYDEHQLQAERIGYLRDQ